MNFMQKLKNFNLRINGLIQLITQSNFPHKVIQNLNLQIQHKKTNQDQINRNNKNKNGQPSHTTAQE